MSEEIRPVGYSEMLFKPLLAEADAEAAPFLFRLRDEWESGKLRFDGEGELLLGAFEGDDLIGVAGISHDPYAHAPGLGRVRHVYVLKAYRRTGVARRLLERLIDHARGRFTSLRLSARDRPDAIRLYERLGFVPGDREKETHRLTLAETRAHPGHGFRPSPE